MNATRTAIAFSLIALLCSGGPPLASNHAPGDGLNSAHAGETNRSPEAVRSADEGDRPVAPTKKNRLVMAQVHRLEGMTAAEIGSELDRFRNAGFNALILRVFQNRGDRFHASTGLEKGTDRQGVYFATGRAPVVVDLVTLVAPLARARGLKLYAWITTRRMDWLDRPDWRDVRLDETTGQPVANNAHDLFNAAFQEYLLALLADLAATPIDGIILQDDFTILTREGLTPSGLSGFQRVTGLAAAPADLFSVRARARGGFSVLPGSKLFPRWSVYKADHLANLGERIVTNCRAVRPEIELGINLYSDTVLDPAQGREWLGQDLDGIIRSPFDRVLLMAYHRQLSHERALDVTEAIAALAAKSTELEQRLGQRLIVKLEARDWRTGEEPGDAETTALAGMIPAPDTNIAFAPVERDSALFRTLGRFLGRERKP